jgi:hypothetical protein
MFTRVRDFMSENLADFPAKSLAREKFTLLEAAIADLVKYGTDETSGRNAGAVSAVNKKLARQALREQMQVISRTAARMAESTPGMENNFRVPRTNGDQALLNTARAFAADATPMKTQFVKWELPESFIEDLGAAIEKFEQADNSQNQNRTKSVTATAAIDDAIERGKQAVRDLERILRNKYKGENAKLAAWETASHLERAPHSRKKEINENTTEEADK